MAQKILVTGPFGQIGSELLPQLQKKYGVENVVALGHNYIPEDYKGPLEKGDVANKETLEGIMKKHQITIVYHLAAVLSVTGQSNPGLCWDVNLLPYKTIFDICVALKVKRIFVASSMSVFGPTAPKQNTPQQCSIEPTTMYGLTKYTGEMLGSYYHKRFGLDVRSVRYPGIISWKTSLGGGTTNYAVDIFQDAVKKGEYECFVTEETRLPMMYIDDAIKATIDIMEAPSENLKTRMSYNIGAINFSVKQLAEEIKKTKKDFKISYKPDSRQEIADSWPNSLDDSWARNDWGWKHSVDLTKLTQIMLENMEIKFKDAKK